MKNLIFIALAMLVFTSCAKEELVLDEATNTTEVMEKAALPPPCCDGLDINTLFGSTTVDLQVTADAVISGSYYEITVHERVSGPDILVFAANIQNNEPSCMSDSFNLGTSGYATSGKSYRAKAKLFDANGQCGGSHIAIWTQP